MEFIMVSPEKLKVALSPEDMEELDVSYDSLDYADPDTRAFLVSLLERGKLETGFAPRKAKLFIEAFPSERGGCIIIFTCLRTGRYPAGIALSPGGPEAAVFRFDDADALAEAAAKAFQLCSHRVFKSALYRMDGGYRLIVYPLDYADHLSLMFLGEFAPQTGEGEVIAAFIEEHGEVLIERNALETLAKHFG